MRFPILLLRSTKVPSATHKALVKLKLSTRYIVGSAAAVSEGVRVSLGVSSGNRIAGGDVAGDATALASRARAEGWLPGPTVGFAANVPDAIAAGAYMGRKSGPMLLVLPDAIPQTTQDYASTNKSTIAGGVIFGNAGEVSESVLTTLSGLIN